MNKSLLIIIFFTTYHIGCSSVQPIAFHPPTPPKMEGALEPNQKLQSAELIAKGKIVGPMFGSLRDFLSMAKLYRSPF